MHRRQFLNPEHLVRGAGEVLGVLDCLREASPQSPQELSLLRFARRAMATSFEVFLPLGVRDAQHAADAALDEVDRLETQLTVYRDDSEVSRINRLAYTEDVEVEENLFELFALCNGLTAETEGAFDISTGAMIKTWGFFRRAGRVPDESERLKVLQRCGMRNIDLNVERKSIRFRTPGLELNLGSTGKGYALDRAAKILREHKLEQTLLHGGGSSVLALGNEPGSKNGWRVGLANPLDSARDYAIVHLRDRALGTSGKRQQGFEHNGRRLGHILDPRRGWPAEGVLSVSVLAPTAALADGLATAFFVLGIEKTRAFCARYPKVAAIMVPEESRPRPIAIGADLSDIDILQTRLD